MSTTKIRIRFTQAQKLELREHRVAQPEQSQRMVCVWAQEHFKLPRHLPISALWDVLRSKDGEVVNISSKNNQLVHFPQLEAEPVRWIAQCERLQLPFVNGDTICVKAQNIRYELLLSASQSAAERLKGMKYSSGWLFQVPEKGLFIVEETTRGSQHCQRHNGKQKTSSAEAGNKRLREVNIFNMDETAYFYCASPTSTITRNRISGRKQMKKRLTVAFSCSTDGSLKLPLFFVGRARQPSSFKSKSAEDLDLEYGNSPKGVMNTRQFQWWVS
uniref:DNA binding protein putative n=1 Tax=Albugo laibachii Nc14 TaxID=890382 RepID=F0WWD0_9STRA|nr:DNA binding protein putative [Albugo laibachii Nc14]|eukprot:CCA25750.1 DNA binding protein putative [Albugo laibachii Nc14]